MQIDTTDDIEATLRETAASLRDERISGRVTPDMLRRLAVSLRDLSDAADRLAATGAP